MTRRLKVDRRRGCPQPLQENTDDGVTVYFLRDVNRGPLAFTRVTPVLAGDTGRRSTRTKPG